MDDSQSGERLAWVDYAKGICIFGVVSFYAVLKVSSAWGDAGWMQYWADFARTFRMPDFFFLSGLFLASTIDRPWLQYLDRKVLHYLYFFVLWTLVYVGVDVVAEKLGVWSSQDGKTLTDQLLFFPFSMLWFIQILPVFFLVARLLRPVPRWLVFTIAVVLQTFPLDVSWTNQVVHFCERFVFFYAGYLLGPAMVGWMRRAGANLPVSAIVALGWIAVNAIAVLGGYAQWPVVSLFLGLAGALAIGLIGVLMSKSPLFAVVRIAGEHSLLVYVGFFLPMMAGVVAARLLALPIDNGTLALGLTAGSIFAAFIMARAANLLHLGWLFERPAGAKLGEGSERRLAAR